MQRRGRTCIPSRVTINKPHDRLHLFERKSRRRTLWIRQTSDRVESEGRLQHAHGRVRPALRDGRKDGAVHLDERRRLLGGQVQRAPELKGVQAGLEEQLLAGINVDGRPKCDRSWSRGRGTRGLGAHILPKDRKGDAERARKLPRGSVNGDGALLGDALDRGRAQEARWGDGRGGGGISNRRGRGRRRGGGQRRGRRCWHFSWGAAYEYLSEGAI